MHSLILVFISLLLYTILSIQLTTSASFPNPPIFPSPDASEEEWKLFWELLHNYYAIIARPRFGKRSDLMFEKFDHPSLIDILQPKYRMNSLVNDQNRDATDQLYSLMDSD